VALLGTPEIKQELSDIWLTGSGILRSWFANVEMKYTSPIAAPFDCIGKEAL
jgi:hypothetical protein